MIVPKSVNHKIKFFISKIGLTAEPVYIEVKPEVWALPDDCFFNVQKMVERYGGSRILGWAISESFMMMEAIFHAAYKTPSGQLIDITPPKLPISKILFVEDGKTPYTGKVIDNFRLNTTDNPVVDDFIKLAKLYYTISNYKERAYKNEVRFTGEEAKLLNSMYNLKNHLEIFILNGNIASSPCFCGNNKKYYECHGDGLPTFINDCMKMYQE